MPRRQQSGPGGAGVPSKVEAGHAALLREVGARIRKARTALGEIGDVTAARAGCHVNWLYRVEQGTINPGLVNFLQLLAAVGLTPAEVLGEGRPPPTALEQVHQATSRMAAQVTTALHILEDLRQTNEQAREMTRPSPQPPLHPSQAQHAEPLLPVRKGAAQKGPDAGGEQGQRGCRRGGEAPRKPPVRGRRQPAHE